MLQLEMIQEGNSQNQAVLEQLRGKYVSAMSQLLARWDRRDHWLLRIGFTAFVFSAVLNVISLALAD